MSKYYQIDYDLRQPGRNYDSLIPAIKTLGTSWCHPLKSSWVVEANSSASQIALSLRLHIDANDGLLVTRLQGEAAWYSIDPTVSAWLQGRLPQAASIIR